MVPRGDYVRAEPCELILRLDGCESSFDHLTGCETDGDEIYG